MAHLETALAYYLAKQSVSTCLCVFIYSLSLSKVLRILQLSLWQFNLVPRMSHGCSVCHYERVLSWFGCLSSVFTYRANSRLVPDNVTSWFSVKVGFAMLKYDTSNLALNIPSHVSHLTLWGPSDIRTLQKNVKRFLHQTCNFHCIWCSGKHKCRVNFI